MIYVYSCPGCQGTFDVIKSVREFDNEELCPVSGVTMTREFAPRYLHLAHTKVQEAEFNPGLGCVVKNRQHVKEICKQRGLEEIGNEKPETVHKHYDERRRENWERGWADATKGWVGSE